jgi:serine protease Do
MLVGCSRSDKSADGNGADNSNPTPPADNSSATPPPSSVVDHPTPVPQMDSKPLVTRVSQLEETDKEFERLANAVLPAVVSLACTYPVDDSVKPLFNFHFHHPPPDPEPSAFGSGVIISHDGYIVTNHHVIDKAQKIEVRMSDGRKFISHLIASDDLMDLAVIKIDATDLPTLPWGDSDKLQIGQQVFSAGNPFNLNDTFCNGVVSAVRRNLDPDDFDDFVQTNAAINPGNSGGALVNIHGECIGINTAIETTSGGNQGIGFAIPSNLAKFAVSSLIKTGHVVRGFLGVHYETKTISDEVRDQLGLDSDQGALVTDVQANSPAAAAGLKSWDFITAVDGHHIVSPAALRLVIAQIAIGREVSLTYIRDGTQMSTKVTIAQFIPPPTPPPGPKTADITPTPNPGGDTTGSKATVLSGITVADLDPKIRQQFKIDPKVKDKGAVVVGVVDGCLASLVDIEPGNIILSARVNRTAIREINNAADFNDLAKSVRPGESVLLLISRGESGGFVTLPGDKVPK